MDDDQDYREALRTGLRRAALHWIRASYEVVAGVGALLDEVAGTRRHGTGAESSDGDDEGPVRIELE